MLLRETMQGVQGRSERDRAEDRLLDLISRVG